MKPSLATSGWIWLIAVILLIIYELIAVFTGGATLSQFMWFLQGRDQFVPLMLTFIGGMLVGHFFWRKEK